MKTLLAIGCLFLASSAFADLNGTWMGTFTLGNGMKCGQSTLIVQQTANSIEINQFYAGCDQGIPVNPDRFTFRIVGQRVAFGSSDIGSIANNSFKVLFTNAGAPVYINLTCNGDSLSVDEMGMDASGSMAELTAQLKKQ